jgi:hypothetical protein
MRMMTVVLKLNSKYVKLEVEVFASFGNKMRLRGQRDAGCSSEPLSGRRTNHIRNIMLVR